MTSQTTCSAILGQLVWVAEALDLPKSSAKPSIGVGPRLVAPGTVMGTRRNAMNVIQVAGRFLGSKNRPCDRDLAYQGTLGMEGRFGGFVTTLQTPQCI